MIRSSGWCSSVKKISLLAERARLAQWGKLFAFSNSRKSIWGKIKERHLSLMVGLPAAKNMAEAKGAQIAKKHRLA